MPIYEFQCENCCHCFEMLVMGSDDKQLNCPECGSDRVKRLMSSTCFIDSSGSSRCSSSSSKGFS